jgi:predicted Co/Zn/Cd cation transporter (cation efflux family)
MEDSVKIDTNTNMRNSHPYAWVTTVIYVLCVSAFGIMCGLITGSVIIQNQDGFKSIADLLGLAIAGAVIGLLIGFLTAFRLNHRQKKFISIILAIVVIAFSTWIATEMN